MASYPEDCNFSAGAKHTDLHNGIHTTFIVLSNKIHALSRTSEK